MLPYTSSPRNKSITLQLSFMPVIVIVFLLAPGIHLPLPICPVMSPRNLQLMATTTSFPEGG